MRKRIRADEESDWMPDMRIDTIGKELDEVSCYSAKSMGGMIELISVFGDYYAIDSEFGRVLKVSEDIFQGAVQEDDPLAALVLAHRLDLTNASTDSAQEVSVPVAVVFVTHRCNLLCPYCYDRSSVRYGACNVDAICKAILSTARDGRVRVHFFGGEPTLELDTIRDIMKQCQRMVREGLLSKVAYSMTTNGTLFNRDTVDFLNRNRISVRLSADGYSDGVRTWGAPVKVIDDALLTWATLLDSCVVRCTVMAGWTSGIVEMLSLWRERGVLNVALAPAIDGSTAFTSDVRDEYLELLHRLARAVRAGRFPVSYIENFNRVRSMIGSGWSVDVRERGWCDVQAVDVDGRIFPCHRLVSGGMAQPVEQISDECGPRCASCWARTLCQGLCSYELSICDADTLDNLCEIYMAEVEFAVWALSR